MNYYIDFDNTLYETAKLTVKMLDEIATFISKNCGKNKNEILNELTDAFDSTKGNIFNFTEEICKKYGVNSKDAVANVENIINNGKDNVFKDAKRFLKRLKENGHKVYLLTYIPNKNNTEYQMMKIDGSGIKNYFDDIIITSKYKFTLDLNYKNGIFIDDDPRDLNGLYEQHPIRVIRIRKKNNKRSKIDINNNDIEEYESFDDIKIEKSIDCMDR